jgi:hypothetical protein
MSTPEQLYRPFGTALVKETAEEKRLVAFKAQYTAEQLADARNREMDGSIALLKQWTRETEECKVGGPVDQRMAAINALNATLPERERNQRRATIAKQKFSALQSSDDFLEDSERPSVIVPRASLLKVRKHRARATYSVIDTFNHEAVVKDLENLPLAHAVAGMVSADPRFAEDVSLPWE